MYVCMYGMVWYGMVWYGMVWYGMVWYVCIYVIICIYVYNVKLYIIYIYMCVCALYHAYLIPNMILNIHKRYRSGMRVRVSAKFTHQTEAEEHKIALVNFLSCAVFSFELPVHHDELSRNNWGSCKEDLLFCLEEPCLKCHLGQPQLYIYNFS